MQWSPLASTPRALEHTHRAPNFRATHHQPRSNRSSRLYALPQLHAKDAPPVGSVPSTAHGVVLTTRLCALHAQEGRPHSPAIGPQLRTEGVPTGEPHPVNLPRRTTCGPRALNCAPRRALKKRTDASLLGGSTSSLTKGALLAGRARSTARGGVSTCAVLAGPETRTEGSPVVRPHLPRRGPHPRAGRPHLHTDGSPPS